MRQPERFRIRVLKRLIGLGILAPQPMSLRRWPPPEEGRRGACQFDRFFSERAPFVPVARERQINPETAPNDGVVGIERSRPFRLDLNALRLARSEIARCDPVLSPAVRGRQSAGAKARLQLPIGQTGPLCGARLLGRQSPAPNPLLLEDYGERYPNIGIGRLSLRRCVQAIARACDPFRL